MIKMDVIAIIGSNRVGLPDELGRLLVSHKIAIIEDKATPERNLCVAWVQRGSKESIDEAIMEAKPLSRGAKKQLIRQLRKNIKIPNQNMT